MRRGVPTRPVCPNFGSRPGLDYFGGSLASPHECTCIGFYARARLDRHGFTRQHRLVEENRPVHDLHIGGYYCAQR